MIAGKPNRLASLAAVLLLAVANALVVSGHPFSPTHLESRKTLQVALQSPQRALVSRATLRTASRSSPEQSRFTAHAVRAHSPVAEFLACFELSRAARRSLATGFESASGRAPPCSSDSAKLSFFVPA